jgi:hypothetical protein
MIVPLGYQSFVKSGICNSYLILVFGFSSVSKSKSSSFRRAIMPKHFCQAVGPAVFWDNLADGWPSG